VVRRVSGYKKIRFHTHENIGYGPVNLPDQELHTTAVWWQLPQRVLDRCFDSREDALDGFLGAAYALHLVAMVSVMAEGRDLQKAVGSGDGAWFVAADLGGRGQLRSAEDGSVAPDEVRGFTPTIFLYDNHPGGVGLSLPLFERREELRQHALGLVRGCACKAGCPGCVGPVLASAEVDDGTTAKAAALTVLELLGEPA